jgi:hypothetical protein
MTGKHVKNHFKLLPPWQSIIEAADIERLINPLISSKTKIFLENLKSKLQTSFITISQEMTS